MKIASAFDYVDVVIEQLCQAADECGLNDVRRHVDGLCEVGARLRCAQAIDEMLGDDLAAAHEAGENGEDVQKRLVPQWRMVEPKSYDGNEEALTYGKKDTPQRKGSTEEGNRKRAAERRR